MGAPWPNAHDPAVERRTRRYTYVTRKYHPSALAGWLQVYVDMLHVVAHRACDRNSRFDGEDLEGEFEGAAGRDTPLREAAFAIALRRGNDQEALLTNCHAEKSLIPGTRGAAEAVSKGIYPRQTKMREKAAVRTIL